MKNIIILLALGSLLFSSCGDKDCWEDKPACGMSPDPGLCQAAIPKWYFDEASGNCKQFTWGGCGDYPFDSKEACEVCKCND